MLAPAGVLVMCAQNDQAERVASGACAVQLAPVYRVDVIPYLGRKGRLFSVHVFVREGFAAPDLRELQQRLEASALAGSTDGSCEQLVLRDEDGARTDAARALRAYFGLFMDPSEPPSPPLRRALEPSKTNEPNDHAG